MAEVGSPRLVISCCSTLYLYVLFWIRCGVFFCSSFVFCDCFLLSTDPVSHVITCADSVTCCTADSLCDKIPYDRGSNTLDNWAR
ncbi:hypothetical protein K474DRAFT_300231 [Panus rudis PR-1116 ss-1]|nr:hypothetical protein K474DRAFT_300231 [Panus rudis PR-1116 ss-1]